MAKLTNTDDRQERQRATADWGIINGRCTVLVLRVQWRSATFNTWTLIFFVLLRPSFAKIETSGVSYRFIRAVRQASTGVVVDDAVVSEFNEVKLGRVKAKFLIYKIDNTKIVKETKSSASASFDDLRTC